METKDLLKCAYCDQRFSKRDHRKRHERSHTNTKPYACHLCGRKYARSDVLLRHVRLHSEKDNILPPSSQRSSHPRMSGSGADDSKMSISSEAADVSTNNNNTSAADMSFKSELDNESFAYPPHPQDHLTFEHHSHHPFDPSQPPPPHSHFGYHGDDDTNPEDMSADPTQGGDSSVMPNDEDDAYGVELLRTLGQGHQRTHYDPNSSSSSAHPSSGPAPPGSGHHPHYQSPPHHHYHLPPPPPQHPPHHHHHHDRAGQHHHPHPHHHHHHDSSSQQHHSGFGIHHHEGSGPPPSSRSEHHYHHAHYSSSQQQPQSPSADNNNNNNSNNDATTNNNHEGGENSNSSGAPPTDPALFWPHGTPGHRSVPPPLPPPSSSSSAAHHPHLSQSTTNVLDLSSLVRRSSPGPESRGSGDPVASMWLTRTDPRDTYSNMSRKTNSSSESPAIKTSSRHVDHVAAGRVWKRLESGSLSFELPLPSVTLMNELIDLYFEYWHPLWPMIHPPTFDAPTANSLLLLGLCSIGALFLDNPGHFDLSLALSNKLLEHVSAVMSPTLCPSLDNQDRDVLQICQAAMLRQLYGLASGDRKSLQSGHLFHASPANLAREAGLLDPSLYTDYPDEEVNTRWHKWARNESRKRTAFAFLLNDLYFSQLFISSPHFTAGSISFPLPSTEDPFQAPDAETWALRMRNAPTPTTPYYELALNLFTERLPVFLKPAQLTPFGLQTLIGSIFAVVLSTRFSRRYLDHDIVASPGAVMPLANALTSALVALPDPSNDVMSARVLWDAAWIHLLVDMRTAELACGREGPSQKDSALPHFKEWSVSARSRRALLHAIDIQTRIKQTVESRHADIHVLTSLFHSWIVLRIYLSLSTNPAQVYIPQSPRDWRALGNVGLAGMPAPNHANASPQVVDTVYWIEHGRFARGYITEQEQQEQDAAAPPTSPPAIKAESQDRSPTTNNEARSTSPQPATPSSSSATRRTRSSATNQAQTSTPTNNDDNNGNNKLKVVHAMTWMSQVSSLMRSIGSFPLRQSLANLVEAIEKQDPMNYA